MPDVPLSKPERRDVLKAARAHLEATGSSGRALADRLGKHASTINGILRGDWPHREGWGWPRYFDLWLSEVGLNPEGTAHRHVLCGEDGTPLADGRYTVRLTDAEARRRNAERAAADRIGRWDRQPDAWMDPPW